MLRIRQGGIRTKIRKSSKRSLTTIKEKKGHFNPGCSCYSFQSVDHAKKLENEFIH